ncbi:unnamed protein product, partial [Rotaria magnacalcarata]
LQDATIDSSSNSPTAQATADASSKNQIEVTSPGKVN